MKRSILVCLVFMFLATSAYGVIARYECVRTNTAAGNTFAGLNYTDNGVINVTGSWLMIGDLLSGANHYSDGVTKFDIPDAILPGDTINSAYIEGYFHANSGGSGHVYMSLQNYATENGGVGIDYNTDSPNVVTTTPFALLDFDGGEKNYQWDVTADIAAKVAAGADWASYAWQAAYADGSIRGNGSEVPPIYQAIGFCNWNWDPAGLLDSPALVIDYTPTGPTPTPTPGPTPTPVPVDTIARYETVGGGAATQTYAQLSYDGSTVDFDGVGGWLMIGDHLNGANHYSDGITKFDIPDEILPSYTINSARIEGYFHVNSGGLGNVYMGLRSYTFDNTTLPISWADSPDTASMYDVAVLDFDGGERDYWFDITADIADKVAAGYDYASYSWWNTDAAGVPRANGPEVPPAINMIGFCGWEWGPAWDKVALVIDYSLPESCEGVDLSTVPDSDLNFDCNVDWRDLNILGQRWLTSMDFEDFRDMANHWRVPPYPETPFVDFGLSFNTLAETKAMWIDYNKDGYVDLYTAIHYNELWRNNGGASFTLISNSHGRGYSVCGDYDNDGYDDIFNPLRLELYHNTSGTGFSTEAFPALPDVGWGYAACWGDWDSDGYIDLYVTGWEDPPAAPTVVFPDSLVMNNQDSTFSVTWTQPERSFPGSGATACDFDEDSDMDIYVSNYRLGANLLWQNNGTGSAFPFVDVAFDYGVAGHYTPGDVYAPPIAYGHTIGSAWGDFDNDGHFDLFVGNFRHDWDDGSQDYAGFYRNKGPGNPAPSDDWHFELMDQLDGVDWQESYACPALADYDNDGDLDLYFTTVYPGDNPVLYRNDGDWTFTNVTAAKGLAGLPDTWQAAWADIDNDGDLDLATANKIFVNPGNPNSWLKVRLEGDLPPAPNVNRSALGAQARIVLDDGRVVARQVDGGMGNSNQNELTLHFGLGQQSSPVDIEIRWPDGHVQTENGVSVNQSVTIDLSYSP